MILPIKYNDMFYVAKDTEKGGKIVSSFKNIDKFLIWYDKQTVKNFYEKIIDERVEYYDIDGKPNENEYYKNDSCLCRFYKGWSVFWLNSLGLDGVWRHAACAASGGV